MLALFGNLSLPEIALIGAVAILVFGRRLPEVATEAAKTVARFRNSLQALGKEIDADGELRKTRQEVAGILPRDLRTSNVLDAVARSTSYLEPKSEADQDDAQSADIDPHDAAIDRAEELSREDLPDHPQH